MKTTQPYDNDLIRFNLNSTLYERNLSAHQVLFVVHLLQNKKKLSMTMITYEKAVSVLQKCLLSDLLPQNPETDRLITGLSTISTYSDFNQFLVEEASALYRYLDRSFIILADQCADKRALREEGILINPREIPKDGPDKYVAYTLSEKTVTQCTDKEVSYPCPCHVDIYLGQAILANPHATCHAYHEAKVESYGAEITAQDRSIIQLNKESRCKAEGQATLYLNDRTFAEVNGQTKVYVQDQGQCWVYGDCQELHLKDTARAFILQNADKKNPIEVSLSDDALLISTSSQLRFQRSDFRGLCYIINQATENVYLPQLMDLAIPRRGAINHPQPLSTPIALDSLKRQFSVPSLFSDKQTDKLIKDAVQKAGSEKEILDILTEHMPKAQHHLHISPNLLASYFTKENLEAHNIHLFDDPIRVDPMDTRPHFVFGDHVVKAKDFPHGVYLFNGALGISQDPTDKLTIGQFAQAIAFKNGRVEGFSNAFAIATGQGECTLHQKAHGILLREAQGHLHDQSAAYATDHSHVTGKDQARIHLANQSTAEVTDQTVLLSEGDNKIIATGHAEIAWTCNPVHQNNREVKATSSVKKRVLTSEAQKLKFLDEKILQIGEPQRSKQVRHR